MLLLQDLLGARAAAAQLLLAREHLVHDRAIEVEERGVLEGLAAEDLCQRGACDRPATEARNHSVDRAVPRGAYVSGHDAADTDREALFEHDHALCACQRLVHRLARPGPEARDA